MPASASRVWGRPGRHLDQRAVGEDDVGGHAGGVGERPAPGLERGEQALVLLGDLGERRARSAPRRRRGGRCRRGASGVASPRSTGRAASVRRRAPWRSGSGRIRSRPISWRKIVCHSAFERSAPTPKVGSRSWPRVRTLSVVSPRRMAIRCSAPKLSPVRRHRREGHARRLGAVEGLGAVAAEVAVAARFGQGLAEVGEQRLAAAALGLGEAEQRVQALVVGLLALHRRGALVDLGAAQADVVGAVERQGVGGRAVAAGAADLLVVALDRLRQVGVGDVADVGLVDAHAEGDGGADDEPVLALEAGLGEAAVVGLEAGVVGERGVAGLAERARPAPRSWRGWRSRRCRTGRGGRRRRRGSAGAGCPWARNARARFGRSKPRRKVAGGRPSNRRATISARVSASAVAVSATVWMPPSARRSSPIRR